MKRKLLAIAILFMFDRTSLVSQGFGYDTLVSTHIELRKDTLLLGEPTFFDYVINNHSDKPIFVEEGGDYRGGREETFSIIVLDENKDTIQLRNWQSIYGGGMVGFRKLMPGQSRKFKLFLPKWVVVTKPGVYTLVTSKRFRIAPENPFHTENFTQVEIVPKESSAPFVVTNNPKALGTFIETLTTKIKHETQGDVVNGSSYITGEKTSMSVSIGLYECIKMVEEINDNRIIPFLEEAYREQKYITQANAIGLLAKFSKEDNAFKTLKYAAQGHENTRCFVSEDSINLVCGSDDIRQIAIRGIMNRNDKRAVDFLITQKNNDFPCERYLIVILAQSLLSQSNRTLIYKAFLSDKHKVIRAKAKEEYEKMLKEE